MASMQIVPMYTLCVPLTGKGKRKAEEAAEGEGGKKARGQATEATEAAADDDVIDLLDD